MRGFILSFLALAWCSAAGATNLAVEVRAPGGSPVAGAVVAIHLVGRSTPLPSPLPMRSISQQNLQFHPFVLVVPAGTAVAFPNLDPVRHHVYSFAPAKRFDLKLFAKEQSRSVLFDKPGVVPIGCNIHDQMTAFIDVVDTPWVAITDVHGNAAFTNLPVGPFTTTVWHPYLKSPGNQLSRQSSGEGRQTFTAALRSPPRPLGGASY